MHLHVQFTFVFIFLTLIHSRRDLRALSQREADKEKEQTGQSKGGYDGHRKPMSVSFTHLFLCPVIHSLVHLLHSVPRQGAK